MKLDGSWGKRHGRMQSDLVGKGMTWVMKQVIATMEREKNTPI